MPNRPFKIHVNKSPDNVTGPVSEVPTPVNERGNLALACQGSDEFDPSDECCLELTHVEGGGSLRV